MNEEQVISRLAESVGSVLGDLRSGLSLNKEAFDVACDSLKFLANNWRERDCVSRRAILPMLGTVDFILGISRQCKDDNERQMLEAAAVTIDELIRSCFLDV